MLAEKTRAAVDALEVPADDFRSHLGASMLGRPCGRQIWYSWRWAWKEQHEPRVKRLFRRGDLQETEFIRLLEECGVRVYAAGQAGDHKDALRISFADGHGGGTPDAVGVGVPDLPLEEAAILEFKTHNEKSFTKLTTEGLLASKLEHFVQMQLYMHGHGLRWALYCAVNKNDDSLHWELVPYDRLMAIKYLRRAADLVGATEPPPRINESPSYWACKFCAFRDICHHGGMPEINCRTCIWSSPGPQGSWRCARDRPEIAAQQGCDEHNYHFGMVGVTHAEIDFDTNTVRFEWAGSRYEVGPRCRETSRTLYADGRGGLPPF